MDQWVLEPLPGTDSEANLIQKIQKGGTLTTTDFGDFRMPFELTLDRLE